MNSLVVGGGIAGLFSAIYLQKMSGQQVVLVEAGVKLGGLLSSFSYPEVGSFDCGVHTFSPTDDEAIDSIVIPRDLKDGWRELPGDLAANFWHGKWVSNSPYLDVRERSGKYGADWINSTLDSHPVSTDGNFYSSIDYLVSMYGEEFTNEVLSPILFKVFGFNANALTAQAAKFLPFDRVIAFGIQETLDRMHSEAFRRRFAILDRTKLPAEFNSRRKVFYPQRAFLDGYVSNLEQKFIGLGGIIKKECLVRDFKIEDGHVTVASLSHKDSTVIELQNLSNVVWTAGFHNFLKNPSSPIAVNTQVTRNRRTVLVHIVVRGEDVLGENQYGFVYTEDYLTYRVVNYQSYAPLEAITESGHRKYTLECTCPIEMSLPDIKMKLFHEILGLHLVVTMDDIVFYEAVEVPAGLPSFSLEMEEVAQRIRASWQEKGWKNLVFVGGGTSPELFYQRDILKDAKKKIDSLITFHDEQ